VPGQLGTPPKHPAAASGKGAEGNMRLRSLLRSVLLLAVLVLAAFYVMTMPSTLPPDALKPRNANLANGETMFSIGGCASCHATPKQDNRLTLGGGLALHSPFGTFKVPNISSDPSAGIGAWTELQFANAVLKGVGRNNEHLYPAFPYTSYQRMTLDDVRDLFAFLKSVPPDTTPPEPHQLPFPFNIRRSIGGWKLLFLDGKPFTSDPARDAAQNRGVYLVEGPGHCAECHSARNDFGAIKPSQRFAGGADPEGKGGWVPNITPHADGLASWSAKDIEYMLETGLTPDGSAVASTMADVVKNTAKLSAPDRTAMAIYLKALPPREGKRPARK
jgi:mono/diheme cytochrome c family protein